MLQKLKHNLLNLYLCCKLNEIKFSKFPDKKLDLLNIDRILRLILGWLAKDFCVLKGLIIMNRCKPKRDLLSLLLLVSCYSLICVACVTFLSESVRAKPNNTTVQLAQHQSNAGQDATRANAQKVFDEGVQLYKQQTKESLLKAIEKLEVALRLWHQISDKKWEAVTLNNIGHIYSDLGEKQKALQWHHQKK